MVDEAKRTALILAVGWVLLLGAGTGWAGGAARSHESRARSGVWRLEVKVGTPQAGRVGERVVAIGLPDGVEGVTLGALREVRREGGQAVPATVAEDGPARRLLFRAPAAGAYTAIFDGDPAAGPSGPGEPRGKAWPEELALSVRGLRTGRPPATPREAQEALRSARPLYGEGRVARLHLRQNPYGLHGRYVARYAGTLEVRRGGTWTFRVRAGGPSFLSVDGRERLAAARRNRRRWGLRVHGTDAAVPLAAGRHAVECLYVNLGGPPHLEVLARAPGAEDFEEIAPSAWFAFERPEETRLLDAGGKPVPFLVFEPAGPARSVGDEVRCRGVARVLGGGAGGRIAVDGKEVGRGEGVFPLWLCPGAHRAVLTGPGGTRVVQAFAVPVPAWTEPFRVRLDAVSLPSFAYAGNERRLHLAVRIEGRPSPPVEGRVTMENGARTAQSGRLTGKGQVVDGVTWLATVPDAGGAPLWQAVALTVWGRELARQKVAFVPLDGLGGVRPVADAGRLWTADGAALVLVKPWPVPGQKTWPLVRWAWGKAQGRPAVRSLLVAGPPADGPGWTAGARVAAAFRGKGIHCRLVPSRDAPWPCVHDVVALNDALTAETPDAAVLAFGAWDAVVGTPVETFRRAIDFGVALARRRCRRVLVLLPGPVRGDSRRSPYAVAALDTARRHQIPWTEPWPEDTEGESRTRIDRWPPAAAQKALAQRLCRALLKE